jgi:hypothetical protein
LDFSEHKNTNWPENNGRRRRYESLNHRLQNVSQFIRFIGIAMYLIWTVIVLANDYPSFFAKECKCMVPQTALLINQISAFVG